MNRKRVPRRARTRNPTNKKPLGVLIQFVPGGFYHLFEGRLYTGVHRRLASDNMQNKLLALAHRAKDAKGEWTT